MAFPVPLEVYYMELIVPDYYHQFKCIASACPDSCCKEWAVDVDADAAARYRALPGTLGTRLRQVLKDTDDGTVMSIENGRCPMWREDGLCRIQAELGHDALCQVCRDFPRLRHDYGELVELGLELSCPEAARLILSSGTDNVTVTVVSGDESAEDPEALAILRRSRERFLSWLGNEPALPETLTVLLLYAYDVQSELDGGDPAILDPESALTQGRKFAQPGNLADIFSFFRSLEILTPQWREILEVGPAPINWDPRIKNLLVYLIRRYWLQAVSDYDLVGRAKLCIVACLFLSAIDGDIVSNAQLFSKEIENDPDNIDAILDGVYRDPSLTDVRLLGLLL